MLENENSGAQGNATMPKMEWKVDWSKINAELWIAVLSLVIILLPAIMVKLLTLTKEAEMARQTFIASPAFNLSTIAVGFIFSVYALAKNKNEYGTRVIALIALIVTVVRLLLQ